jgi:MoxR-like ATPase
MAERRIAVPRVGEVVAGDTFRVIASMNPYDNIGTTRLSTSVHDRLCRLAITYQDAAAERGIVALRAPLPDLKPARYERLVADAVAVTRATRAHEDIRQGSSVRGAIDLTLVAGQLFNLDPERFAASPGATHDLPPQPKQTQVPAPPSPPTPGATTLAGGPDIRSSIGSGPAVSSHALTRVADSNEEAYRETIYDAMVVALSGRIFLDETVEATPEQVLRQIWEDHFILNPAAANPG